jgi:hypothetical protein
MDRPRWLALATLFLPLAAWADFEGELDGRMTGPHMNGTSKTWVSKAGARMEMEMTSSPEQEKAGAPRSMKMVTIFRAAEPDHTYLLNVEQKTYTVLDAREGTKMRAAMKSSETYTVKRLGTDKVAGLSCDRAVITSSSGQESEICASSDVLGATAWLRALERRGDSGNALLKTLRDAGIRGFPIRWIQKQKEGTITFELVSAKRHSVPASTFEIPPGYQKRGLMGTMTTPEQQKRMEEAMKKMTPEQRKQMEEMMGKTQGGK